MWRSLARWSRQLLMIGAGGACASAGCHAGSSKDDNAASLGDGSVVDAAADTSKAFEPEDTTGRPPECVDLECKRPACAPGVKTTITGIVFDPSGKVPLYNVIVYIPNAPLKPLAEGASCDRCGGVVSGNAIAATLTDSHGQFALENVPAGDDIPLVMQVGKWRRQVTIPKVTACANTSLTDPNFTRLPRSQKEGNLPHIALTTGGADPLECLPRKIGIDDSEFSTEGGTGHVHFFVGDGSGPAAASKFDAAHGGASFAAASKLWGDVERLKKYDVVMLACEGDVFEGSKPTSARKAMFDYASAGGRVFASHFQHTWISQGPPPFPFTGAWTSREAPPPQIVGKVDSSFPKGEAFRDWLVNAGASTLPGDIVIRVSRHDLDAVDTKRAQRWISVTNSNAKDSTGASREAVQYMSFNTPVDAAAETQCGRVVFSDLHVASGDTPGMPFPSGCTGDPLSPQEKALVFMLFDLSSCIQRDDSKPVPPPLK